MTKQNRIKQSLRQNGSVPNQILLIIVIFFVGYLSASFFNVATVSQWVGSKISPAEQAKSPSAESTPQAQAAPKHKFEFYTLLTNEKPSPNANANANPVQTAQTEAKGTTPTAAANAAAQTVTHPAVATNTATMQPAKPSAPINNPIVSQQAQKAPKVITAKPVSQPMTGAFTVQVASFKERKDAEHMKGSLTLKGFNVNVVAISQPSGNWYRVLVGPYANRLLAQKAQENLARNERIRGMISRA